MKSMTPGVSNPYHPEQSPLAKTVVEPGTHPRGRVSHFAREREGQGDMWMWNRVVNGKLYGFTHVKMPDGELRWFVSEFNGYIGGPGWACAWVRVRSWTVKP